MLQYGSETNNKDLRNSIINFGSRIGIIINLVIACFVFLLSFFGSIILPSASIIIRMMFLLPPLLLVFQIVQVYFRVSFENKQFALVSFINSILIFSFFRY